MKEKVFLHIEIWPSVVFKVMLQHSNGSTESHMPWIFQERYLSSRGKLRLYYMRLFATGKTQGFEGIYLLITNEKGRFLLNWNVSYLVLCHKECTITWAYTYYIDALWKWAGNNYMNKVIWPIALVQFFLLFLRMNYLT